MTLSGDDTDRMEERHRMVDEQLRPRAITNERVLQAMLEVPRHLFIPAEAQPYAYADQAVPIEEGQTISQPYVVALMTQELLAGPDAKVLEIGTGSGYQAAVLSRLVNHVYTVERHPHLAQQAMQRFDSLGYANISVYIGDGTAGWPEHAPYDNAIITAGGPRVPRAIIAQVRRSGIILMPVGGRKSQHLERLRIRWLGYSRQNLGRVAFVPLVGRYGWQDS